MSARQWIGPVLAGAAVGVVAAVVGICIQHWYYKGNGDPRCVFDFAHYMLVYEREPGGMQVSCVYDANFPNDVLGAAP